MSSDSGLKRPADPADEAEPERGSKKASTESRGSDSTPQATTSHHGFGSSVDLHLEEFFGVSPNDIYELLLDEKRLVEATGFPVSIGPEIGKEYKCKDMSCKNIHLIPNKLIVQESWSIDTPQSPFTLIIRLITAHTDPTSKSTKLTLNIMNAPAEKSKEIQDGWRNFFVAIRKFLKDDKGKAVPPRVGKNICHMEIPAKDPKKLSKFYSEVFDWRIELWGLYHGFISGPKDSDWGWVDGGFSEIEQGKVPVDHSTVATYIPYYHSEPIEEYEKKVVAAGGRVLKSKYKEFYGEIAECLDPDGNRFNLYQHPTPET